MLQLLYMYMFLKNVSTSAKVLKVQHRLITERHLLQQFNKFGLKNEVMLAQK